MMRNQREKDLSAKEEGSNLNNDLKSSTSSRLWSGLKNPRIVRVSRAFGGKDRHSKVTTIRGLRDRRVRLSVPTAIQLYDLQDRLGLNQPSKVVDWLLNAAREEIDKLPPLQFPPESLIQFSQDPPRNLREDPKEQIREKADDDDDDAVKGSDHLVINNAQVLSHEMASYASYYQWEAANAYLSQLGIRPSQPNDQAQFMSIPYFCPPGIVPSIFASNVNVTPHANLEMNSLDHLSSQAARPFQ